MKAIWNGQLLAESNDVVVIENNHYFPISSLNMGFFKTSDTQTHCPWKGDANYFSIVIGGEKNKDAAWYYPSPKDAATKIKDRVAFWRGVEVIE